MFQIGTVCSKHGVTPNKSYVTMYNSILLFVNAILSNKRNVCIAYIYTENSSFLYFSQENFIKYFIACSRAMTRRAMRRTEQLPAFSHAYVEGHKAGKPASLPLHMPTWKAIRQGQQLPCWDCELSFTSLPA